ncbi:23S rRNA (pseudouridine1915-N3)-methyltransferase [Aequitasia blattaphilus]|uniref:Ribosomal RNA large subunit methyltransferase H n=1 Tax=Aequitasia blattaphilus TaxID=2949332 RepID=A0ABT1E9Y7_9FIRM|nr:23S rRNA (pseudouridine(1915)-N(3))-methyltransferase RlmH [Aequitasia blattaphilus]MCP1101676.1 23S rRNA (pseudouridine(1915)-N(3))-methyltransferase RlmH [Aequitasia blattaphilus]MCR8614316.1 23S rRNA (pseudouridine(1915)-N(3))-methyltransferase RlmH [Aequitasia blattaphilus]
MKITLITVGKIKEKYWKDGIAEYSKRLQKYCKLEVLEVPDEKTPDQASEAVENKIREKEGERILRLIREDSYVIALAIEGYKLSSEELSKKINSLGISGCSHICFVIGGSIGLSETVLKRADYSLSFSDMTFPHQMMRVILLEQIYRSYRIIHNQPYHK